MLGFRYVQYGLMETLYHIDEAVGAEGIEQVEHFFEQVGSAAISGAICRSRLLLRACSRRVTTLMSIKRPIRS